MRAFAGDHLGAWLPSFAAHLRASAEAPLLRHAADLLSVFRTSLDRRLDLPGDPTAATLTPRDEPDAATWPCHLPEPPRP